MNETFQLGNDYFGIQTTRFDPENSSRSPRASKRVLEILNHPNVDVAYVRMNAFGADRPGQKYNCTFCLMFTSKNGESHSVMVTNTGVVKEWRTSRPGRTSCVLDIDRAAELKQLFSAKVVL